MLKSEKYLNDMKIATFLPVFLQRENGWCSTVCYSVYISCFCQWETPCNSDQVQLMMVQMKFVADAAYRIVLQPSSLPHLLRVNSSNPLLQLLYEGTPVVKEFYIDSKKDVDK